MPSSPPTPHHQNCPNWIPAAAAPFPGRATIPVPSLNFCCHRSLLPRRAPNPGAAPPSSRRVSASRRRPPRRPGGRRRSLMPQTCPQSRRRTTLMASSRRVSAPVGDPRAVPAKRCAAGSRTAPMRTSAPTSCGTLARWRWQVVGVVRARHLQHEAGPGS